MPALFCFIDDAVFELDMFRENAAPGFGQAEFVYAHTFQEAKEQIGSRQPACFLLDLYGSDPAVQPRLPEREELAARLTEQVDLPDLYAGAADSGEGANLFLRKLHAQVASRQEAFRFAAGCLGQSSAYGLANLAQVRDSYPLAAALAYSRKALYRDAALFTAAGGDGVLQKPQGADEGAIAQATRRKAPDLARACLRAVKARLAALCSLGDAGQKEAAASALEYWRR